MTLTAATLIGLRDGLTPEAIAARYGYTIADVVLELERLREAGMLRAACGMMDGEVR